MPGLIGFTATDLSRERALDALGAMTALATDPGTNLWDTPFWDGPVCATRSHLGILQPDPQPVEVDGLRVWLDGEFYDSGVRRDESGESQPERLARRAAPGGRLDDPAPLAAVDGIYHAAIYDAARGLVHLVSDRLGMRYLQWTVVRGRFAWSSSGSAFLALPGFAPRVPPERVEQFLGAGSLFGDASWLEGVELVPPGTLLTWDIEARRLQRRQYWWWDRIERLSPAPSLHEAADELGRRLRRSVERRCAAGGRVGLSLSGGLDSRAILAASPDRPNDGEPLVTVTFGRPSDADVRIARLAAALKGAEPHFVLLSERGWLEPRLDGLWWSEGFINILDMHGIEARDEFRRLVDVNLDGYGGDMFLRGGYLTERAILDRYDPDYVARYKRCDRRYLDGIERYAPLGRSEYWVLEASLRRWVAAPYLFELTFMESRKPFAANDLVELAYSLPDEYRYRGLLYRTMLLRTFPLFYRAVPNANTGLPISLPRGSGRVIKSLWRLEDRLERLGSAGGAGATAPPPGSPTGAGRKTVSYADYPAWLRVAPARDLIERVLLVPDALHREYDPSGTVDRLWAEHLAGADHAHLLGRYLTVELRLRQLLAGEFRPPLAGPARYLTANEGRVPA